MAVNARWKGLPWVVSTGVLVGLVVLLVVLLRRPELPAPASPTPVAAGPAVPVAGPTPGAPPTASAAPVAQPGGGTGLLPQPPSGPDVEAPQLHPVDLTALRAKLPDNLYWSLAAPTQDPEVLKQREADTLRWNDLYGKVLSGMATEAEVRQYYAHRRTVSEDLMAFATTVLADYGDQLPEQERGLYELSINMHRTKLTELPRHEQEALARGQAQAQRREAWRQGQQQP